MYLILGRTVLDDVPLTMTPHYAVAEKILDDITRQDIQRAAWRVLGVEVSGEGIVGVGVYSFCPASGFAPAGLVKMF